MYIDKGWMDAVINVSAPLFTVVSAIRLLPLAADVALRHAKCWGRERDKYEA